MIPTQLPTFIQVVEKGSFSAASRTLGISPAAVSKAISQLEKQLNQRLFHRSTHTLTPTQEGAALYEQTAHLVVALQESIQSNIDSCLHLKGVIKINLPDHFGQTVIYPLLMQFLTQYPDIHLDLYFDDKVQDLIENRFDLGIGAKINQDSRLIARPVFYLQPIYVCSNSYLAVNQEPIQPKDLTKHNCIGYRSPTDGRILPWRFLLSDTNDGDKSETWNFTPGGNLVVNSLGAAFKAAQSGFGIACIGQSYLTNEDSNMVQLLQQYQPPPITVWLYYSSKSYVPNRVRCLIDFLLNKLSN